MGSQTEGCCLWMAEGCLLLMTLLAFRRSCSPASKHSVWHGNPQAFGVVFRWSQVHAVPTDALTVPAPKRSYSPGLTREGGSFGKSKLGCFGSCRLVVAAAKVPGPACAKIIPAMAGLLGREGAPNSPRNFAVEQGPGGRLGVGCGPTRKAGGHAQRLGPLCITLYYGYRPTLGLAVKTA